MKKKYEIMKYITQMSTLVTVLNIKLTINVQLKYKNE